MIPAIVRSTHPMPTLAVTTIVVMLAVGSGLEPWRAAVLGVMILANQVSIGLSNDWLDAERDHAVGRKDKPVALGEVSVRQARAVSLISAAVAVALSPLLGWGVVIAHGVFLASGWIYNLGLKRTIVSVLPYAVGFGSLPFIVTLARPEPALPSPWVVLAGALLGVSAHFANVLPDLEDDRATGVVGLPHRLGARATGLVVALGLAGASAAVVLGVGDTHPLRLVGLALSITLAVASGVMVMTRPGSPLVFRLIIAGALLTVLLLASVGSAIIL